MNQYCFLNGEIVPLSEAKVGVQDIGLVRGYGIYEGIPVLNGAPFRFADHWNRFLDGTHALNLNVPVTEEKAEKVIRELVEKNGVSKRSNIRIVLTGGPTINGIEYSFDTPTFYILAEKHEPLPQESYEEGAKLITYNYQREIPEHKTTNYIRAVLLQDFKKEEKAVEILYVHDGEVLECATSNVFLVKDNVLVTPSENILKGITRKVILEIAGDMGLQTEERPVAESELKNADEVFITSSFKDIVPIVKIDDFEVGREERDGEVGEVTVGLVERFAELIKA